MTFNFLSPVIGIRKIINAVAIISPQKINVKEFIDLSAKPAKRLDEA